MVNGNKHRADALPAVLVLLPRPRVRLGARRDPAGRGGRLPPQGRRTSTPTPGLPSRRRGRRGVRMPARIAILVLLLVAAIPTPAWALAGGATGGGGGGGGGFSGGGGGFSGGSGGGSGGNGKFSALSLFITIGAVAFAFGLAFLVNRATKRKAQAQYDGPQATPGRQRSAGQRAKKAEDTAKAAQAGDGYWDPVELKARVRECFFPVQSSWSARDVTPSRPYVSGALYKRHTLQLEGLERQHRVNRIDDLQLDDVEIVRVVDVTDDGQDRFVAFCSAARATGWRTPRPGRWSTATSSRRRRSSSTGPSSATRARLGARRDPAGRGGRLPHEGVRHRVRRWACSTGCSGVSPPPSGVARTSRPGWRRSPSSTTSGRPRRCAAGSATSSSRSSGRGSSATPRSRSRTWRRSWPPRSGCGSKGSCASTACTSSRTR